MTGGTRFWGRFGGNAPLHAWHETRIGTHRDDAPPTWVQRAVHMRFSQTSDVASDSAGDSSLPRHANRHDSDGPHQHGSRTIRDHAFLEFSRDFELRERLFPPRGSREGPRGSKNEKIVGPWNRVYSEKTLSFGDSVIKSSLILSALERASTALTTIGFEWYSGPKLLGNFGSPLPWVI